MSKQKLFALDADASKVMDWLLAGRGGDDRPNLLNVCRHEGGLHSVDGMQGRRIPLSAFEDHQNVILPLENISPANKVLCEGEWTMARIAKLGKQGKLNLYTFEDMSQMKSWIDTFMGAMKNNVEIGSMNVTASFLKNVLAGFGVGTAYGTQISFCGKKDGGQIIGMHVGGEVANVPVDTFIMARFGSTDHEKRLAKWPLTPPQQTCEESQDNDGGDV